MSCAIKAVIFDYGNVLSEAQPLEEVRAMAEVLSMAPEPFEERYWRDRAAYDRAAMDPAEYWGRVAGRAVEGSRVEQLNELDIKSWTHPRESTPGWVDSARRSGLRTALLSNLPVTLRDALESNCPWLPQFDVRTYSCELRVTKPDAAIYERCLAALGVSPSEAIFLDDRPDNVKAAAALGIHAVIFESAERAAADLAAYGMPFDVNRASISAPAGHCGQGAEST